jgi:hypothetical protein
MAATRGGGAKGAPGRTDDAVHIDVVKTPHGRAATAVHVEIEPDKLEQGCGPGDVQRVVAQVPVSEGDRVRWEEHPMERVVERDRAPAKLRYSTTHYGAADTDRTGVRVQIATTSGPVRTGRVRGHDADKPPKPKTQESKRKPRRRR